MGNSAIKNQDWNPGRRNFLRAMPVAAAAGLALTDTSLFNSLAASQAAPAAPATYQLFTAQVLENDIQALDAVPATNTLYQTSTFSVALLTEKAHIAKEFEWHEGKDHVFKILDGSTVIEVGGTPKGTHGNGPGEWLAPESEGSTAITLNKGDMLVIPRMTPHKRSTAGSVTITLVSPLGVAKS
jgi:mannose-6-phosphate isomerase-like protein (cupin superfamily)